MRAADAGIVLIVKRIVRNFVVMDVAPDLLVGPFGEWIDLDEAELGVPFDFVGTGALGGLVTADAGDPRGEFAQFLAERLDLP